MVALAGLIAFGVVAATRRRTRPIPVVPVLVLCLIAAGWLFGATLVWGTGYATKVRWAAAWTYDGGAWQWTALLSVALIGVICLGAALRAFTVDARRRGRVFAAASGMAFVAWSVVVRYSVIAAIAVVVAGGAAVAFLNSGKPRDATGDRVSRSWRGAAIPLLLAAIVVGCAWVLFAFGWLVVGPEGRASCNCWADDFNDWQYQVQFLVAIAGALSLVAASALYARRNRVAVDVTGGIAGSLMCAWVVFLVTGHG